MLHTKDLLGLKNMTAEEICEILDEAERMKSRLNGGDKQTDELRGRSFVTLFYENSTRTRTSFEFAAKFLGLTEINMSVVTSSVQKGETLVDTGRTLDDLKTDFIVIRHQIAGAPHLLARSVKASVINAGDGMDEHPTQALLDFLTMREQFGKIEGLKVAIIGDIKHSRVARSNLYGLNKLGAETWVYGPKTLLCKGIDGLGAHVANSLEEAVEGANVIMGLRIQLERQKGGLFPSISEYSRFYGVKDEHLKLAAPNAVVMHPGPANRGVELSTDVLDGERCRKEEQVTSGLAVRMALVKLLAEYRENYL